MQGQDDCRHSTLARGGRHQISKCTCGTVHLTVANTTLRFRESDFLALAASLRTAAHRLTLDAEAAISPQALPN